MTPPQPRKKLSAHDVAVLEASAHGYRKMIKLIDLGKPGIKQLRRQLHEHLEAVEHDINFAPREGTPRI